MALLSILGRVGQWDRGRFSVPAFAYFAHLATADFETPVKREICMSQKNVKFRRSLCSWLFQRSTV